MPVPLRNYHSETARRLGGWLILVRRRRKMSRSRLLLMLDHWSFSDSVLAELIGNIDENMLVRIETGKMRPAPFWIIDVLVNALECTLEERAMVVDCISPDISSLVPGSALRKTDTYSNPLTVRERDVLKLGRSGMTSREIGDVLVVTKGGIDTHWHNIRKKLGVKSREQAVAIAVQLGLI